jgi:hypothetical protein
MANNNKSVLVFIIFAIISSGAVAATLIAAQQVGAEQPKTSPNQSPKRPPNQSPRPPPNESPRPPVACSPESTYIGPPCEYRI